RAEAEQRARAEKNFRQARRAVDLMSEIGQEEITDKAELQEVRRRLLEAALAYYQDFIDEHRDDPTIEAELAASHLRVATRLSEMGKRAEALAALEQARQLHERMGRDRPLPPELRGGFSSVYGNLDLMRASQLNVLTQKPVQEDLKLSEEQARKINQLA